MSDTEAEMSCLIAKDGYLILLVLGVVSGAPVLAERGRAAASVAASARGFAAAAHSRGACAAARAVRRTVATALHSAVVTVFAAAAAPVAAVGHCEVHCQARTLRLK